MRFVRVAPAKAWYSEWHETQMHPTITVIETDKDSPKIVLPDGTELVGQVEMGFRPDEG